MFITIGSSHESRYIKISYSHFAEKTSAIVFRDNLCLIRSSGMASKGSEVPDIPADLDLPKGYVAKCCKFCKKWSYGICEWVLLGTVLSQWSPYIPWGRGTREKPIGDRCKVCMVVTRHLLRIFCFCFGMKSNECETFNVTE